MDKEKAEMKERKKNWIELNSKTEKEDKKIKDIKIDIKIKNLWTFI